VLNRERTEVGVQSSEQS